LGEGRGNAFIRFLKEQREEDCSNAGTSREGSGASEETISEGHAGANCKSHWKKMIGKPYSGAKLDRRETNRTYGLMRGNWR
jgi:hypothetical protein